ncbi:hypothetical protein AFLA_006125 [Aspergillus flavus NRRL3357]|nr:hypothetical protein AFLA_006125 [Aspergillus flavus NRRL3357]
MPARAERNIRYWQTTARQFSSQVKLEAINHFEIFRYVARRILEALKVLHDNNFVHTDVKPDNILVKYGLGDERQPGGVLKGSSELAGAHKQTYSLLAPGSALRRH